VYVGALGDEGDASLAVAVQGRYAAVYACGADPTREAYPQWVTTMGTYFNEPHVTAAQEGWRFDGAWSGDTASGVLVGPEGTSLTWLGTAVPRPTLAGLYTAVDSGCTSGVIVMGHDTAPLVRGAWCDANGDVRQITPLLPLTLDGGALAVEVETDGAPRRLNVTPINLSLL
jgi:hypothetical protein